MASPSPAQALRFVHHSHPCRVRFGRGTVADTADELVALGARRALLVGTPGRRAYLDALAARLGDRCVGTLGNARQHVPQADADAAVAHANALGADWVVAIGGGSATGLAKAIALRGTVSIACVPTTYSGSEMTPIWGITQDGAKTTGRDDRVRPRLVIYDPDLIGAMPAHLAAASALNALAHCVEALYAADADPITLVTAEEGVRALFRGLENCDPEALLYGAWLGGSVLGAASMGLHHKLCHVLGGGFGLPHAETHAILIPHVIAHNAPAAPAAMARLCRATGTATPTACAAALQAMGRAAGVPAGLAEIGFPVDGIPKAIAAALQVRYPNPRPLATVNLERLLGDATHGATPREWPPLPVSALAG